MTSPNLSSLFTTFSHTSLLYLYFPSQMVLQRFYHYSPPFTSPVTSINAGACDDRHYERESACGRVPKRRGALKIFGCIQVQTMAGCLAGECFIHCSSPHLSLLKPPVWEGHIPIPRNFTFIETNVTFIENFLVTFIEIGSLTLECHNEAICYMEVSYVHKVTFIEILRLVSI